jgi:hypothetical protein
MVCKLADNLFYYGDNLIAYLREYGGDQQDLSILCDF